MNILRKGSRGEPGVGFRRLVAAAASSSLGDGLMVAALPLLVVTKTTDPVLISGLAVAVALPWLLVALPAGALVDRFDKRRSVVNVELARALLLSVIVAGVLTHRMGLLSIYGSAFLIGVGETFVTAVTRSVVPLLVEDGDLPAANGYVFAAETAGERFAGPALGGLIFGVAAALPFIGDAISFVASAFLLRSAVPGTARLSRAQLGSARLGSTQLGSTQAAKSAPSRGIVHEVGTGLRWFVGNAQLRVLAIVVSTFAFCQAMAFAVLVLLATRTLHLDPGGYGVLLAIAGAGDVLASVGAGRVHAFLGPVVTVSVAGLVAGSAYLVIGLDTHTAVTAVALCAEAAAATLGNVATLSARHRLIPPEHFGLINNTFRTCVMAVVPVAAVAGGGLAGAFGLPATFIAAGVVQLVMLLAMTVPLRRISRGSWVAPVADLPPE